MIENTPSVIHAYFNDAKTFYKVGQRILLRPNDRLHPPARWVAGETTSDRFTIEYAAYLVKSPIWAIKHVAFHEVCHIEHALRGLPLFCWETNAEKNVSLPASFHSNQINQYENLNLYGVDIKRLSRDLGAEVKNAEVLFWIATNSACDFLVDSELLTEGPVQSETSKVGILTLDGDYSFSQKKETLLGGIAESGVWDSVVRNIGSEVPVELIQPIIEGAWKVEDFACYCKGLKHKSYENFINALSQVKLTDQGQDFFFMVENVAKTFIPILKDTNAPIELPYFKKD